MSAALASSSGRLTSRSREWLQPMALVAVGLVAALADRGGPRTVQFMLERDATLRSNVAGVRDLPPAFFGDASFRAAQKPGSRHRFGYYRGLGFETLDIGEYRARLKAFYGRDPGRDIVRP